MPGTRMPDRLGEWYLVNEETGIIRLRDDLTKDTLIDTLLEEYAHARTEGLEDTDGREDPHHHPTFWAELGRITVAYRNTPWKTKSSSAGRPLLGSLR